ARGSRWGRLWVAIITLTLGIAKIRSIGRAAKTLRGCRSGKPSRARDQSQFFIGPQKFLDGPAPVLFDSREPSLKVFFYFPHYRLIESFVPTGTPVQAR